MTRPQKEERLHFRATAHQKKVIAHAAELKGITMTEFIMQAAYQAAANLIVDQSTNKVKPETWIAIEAALAAPPQELPELQRMIEKYGHVLKAAEETAEPISKDQPRVFQETSPEILSHQASVSANQVPHQYSSGTYFKPELPFKNNAA